MERSFLIIAKVDCPYTRELNRYTDDISNITLEGEEKRHQEKIKKVTIVKEEVLPLKEAKKEWG